MSIMDEVIPNAAPITAVPDAPPGAPAPARPNLFKSIIAGALSGLAGSAGSTSFGGGLGAGAQGQMQAQAQQADVQRKQEQQNYERTRQSTLDQASLAHTWANVAATESTRKHNDEDFLQKTIDRGKAQVKDAEAIFQEDVPLPDAAAANKFVQEHQDLMGKSVPVMTGKTAEGTPTWTFYKPQGAATISPEVGKYLSENITGWPKNADPKKLYPRTKIAELISMADKSASEKIDRETKVTELGIKKETLANAPAKAALDLKQGEASVRASNASTAHSNAATNALATQASAEASSIPQGMVDGTIDVTKIDRNKRAKFIEEAKKLDPSFSMTNYPARQAVVKDFADGKAATQIVSLGTFAGHTRDASELVDSLRNTKSPLINKGVNEIKAQLGSEKIGPYQAALEAAGTEYMNFLNANHALHESDIELKSKLLNENTPPGTAQAILKQMGHTVLIRGRSLNQQYKNTMNKDYKVLSDDADADLKHLGLDTSVVYGKRKPDFGQSKSAETKSADPLGLR